MNKGNNLKKGKSSFLKKLHYLFDIFMFIISIFAAALLLMLHNAQVKEGQNEYIHLTAKKTKAKHSKIPKSQTAIDSAYALIPKKKVKKYKTVTNLYGYKYQVKLKHPKVKYLASFYLDPNYASKENKIENTIYIPITGSVVDAFKTPSSGQYNFLNSSLGFDANKQYILNDTQTYIQVMQFKSFNKYGKFMVPNADNNSLNVTINEGSSRYLKLSEFTLKRLNKVNLSEQAQRNVLFGGYM